MKMSEGNTTQSVVYVEKIVASAVLYNAEYALLAHNHPNGNGKPSGCDNSLTSQVVNALGSVNVKVLDHIIIYNTGCYSFADEQSYGLTYNK